jgi:hypothetical protein
METFRRLMAFPMFATVAWLVWVLGQQSGIDGAGALLALLVPEHAGVWALTLRGRTRVALAAVAVAGLRAFVGWVHRCRNHPSQGPPPPSPARTGAGSPGRRAACEQLAAGQPVFVDFTAAWCVTCQYNKKTTLSTPTCWPTSTPQTYALLRADWTRRDPAITAAWRSWVATACRCTSSTAPAAAPWLAVNSTEESSGDYLAPARLAGWMAEKQGRPERHADGRVGQASASSTAPGPRRTCTSSARRASWSMPAASTASRRPASTTSRPPPTTCARA